MATNFYMFYIETKGVRISQSNRNSLHIGYYSLSTMRHRDSIPCSYLKHQISRNLFTY